jgi:hypothetical protein
MDIRNIKEEAPKVENDQYLEQMFQFGREQLAAYINEGPEDLPEEFPLNVNIPRNQVVLKDFINRVIEELMEGYESTQLAFNVCYDKGWNDELFKDEDVEELNNHLQNACEEQADAMGFFMTLFLYANIEPEDIYEFAKVYSHDNVHNLDDVMRVGQVYQDLDIDERTLFCLPIEEKNKNYIPGFYAMNVYSHLVTEKEAIFNVIYYLNMARNSLKCRPWKNTQVMTKEIEFQEYLVKAFYMYMGFLKEFKFSPRKIYEEYFKKFKLNMWRIASAY